MKLLRLASVAAVVLGLAFASQASASTVKWVGYVSYGDPPIKDANNVAVGPYQLRLGDTQSEAAPSGSGPVIRGTCVTGGLDWPMLLDEPFQAYVYPGGDSIPGTIAHTPGLPDFVLNTAKLQEAATFNQMWGSSTYSTASIQHAIWSLFEPTVWNATTGTWSTKDWTSTDAGAQALLTAYTNGAIQDTTSPYEVIVATQLVTFKDQKTGQTFTGPQVFITPEPCSLALLGLGLSALGLCRRRRKA